MTEREVERLGEQALHHEAALGVARRGLDAPRHLRQAARRPREHLDPGDGRPGRRHDVARDGGALAQANGRRRVHGDGARGRDEVARLASHDEVGRRLVPRRREPPGRVGHDLADGPPAVRPRGFSAATSRPSNTEPPAPPPDTGSRRTRRRPRRRRSARPTRRRSRRPRRGARPSGPSRPGAVSGSSGRSPLAGAPGTRRAAGPRERRVHRPGRAGRPRARRRPSARRRSAGRSAAARRGTRRRPGRAAASRGATLRTGFLAGSFDDPGDRPTLGTDARYRTTYEQNANYGWAIRRGTSIQWSPSAARRRTRGRSRFPATGAAPWARTEGAVRSGAASGPRRGH